MWLFLYSFIESISGSPRQSSWPYVCIGTRKRRVQNALALQILPQIVRRCSCGFLAILGSRQKFSFAAIKAMFFGRRQADQVAARQSTKADDWHIGHSYDVPVLRHALLFRHVTETDVLRAFYTCFVYFFSEYSRKIILNIFSFLFRCQLDSLQWIESHNTIDLQNLLKIDILIVRSTPTEEFFLIKT